MANEHFFIEQSDQGKYEVKTKDGRAHGSFGTQEEAIQHAKSLNPEDHPDVERVRDTSSGGRDQWRSAN